MPLSAPPSQSNKVSQLLRRFLGRGPPALTIQSHELTIQSHEPVVDRLRATPTAPLPTVNTSILSRLARSGARLNAQWLRVLMRVHLPFTSPFAQHQPSVGGLHLMTSVMTSDDL